MENATIHFDKEYSYLVPGELEDICRVGCRVTVPFGRGNLRRTGLVLDVRAVAEHERLKPVLAVLDAEPLVDAEGMHLLRALKAGTLCTWFDAFRLLIPAGVGIAYKLVYSVGSGAVPETLSALQEELLALLHSRRKPVEESELCGAFGITARDAALAQLVASGAVVKSEQQKQKIMDDKVCMVRLCDDWQPVALTPKQKAVLAFMQEAQTASLKEICYYAGVTRVVVDGLRDKAAVEYYDNVRLRNPYGDAQIAQAETPALSEQQQAAYDRLVAQLGTGGTALLYGVTGSGKTEVFLALIEHVVRSGKRVIVMVPEISLTAQTVESFHQRFGGRVAVLHSALSMGERMDEWRRIKSGGADIVIGTRSAVFAPLDRIGLIVIDEEQEHTYKSDKSPRYHARDVARVRCDYHGALLLLASATPSLESYYHAKQGKYALVTLDERYNQAQLPDVYVVDMREAQNLSSSPSLSSVLLEELHYNLEHGEQSILLLNRRGYSTVIKCSSCATVADCPNCSVALTYHAANDSLLCHYCGYTREKATSCAHCGSSLIRYSGIGTQKLEEELHTLFPDARVLRVDMDTTMSKFSHEKLFSAFAAREYDIMIGTQMVAKGLNFPDVTLVGVLCADQTLYSNDFRSFERSFSLLTQVVGRGGRGSAPGRAFIQTYSPENPIIQLAATQDYPAFYADEITSRRLHLYPPFCTMAGIGFVGEDLDEVQRWAHSFLAKFKELAALEYPGLPVRVLGPVPSDILKAAGKYRYKLILKCKNNRPTRALLTRLVEWFYKECKKVTVFVDMHYDRI